LQLKKLQLKLQLVKNFKISYSFIFSVGGRNAVNCHHIVEIVAAWPSATSPNVNRIHFEEDILTKISKLEN